MKRFLRSERRCGNKMLDETWKQFMFCWEDINIISIFQFEDETLPIFLKKKEINEFNFWGNELLLPSILSCVLFSCYLFIRRLQRNTAHQPNIVEEIQAFINSWEWMTYSPHSNMNEFISQSYDTFICTSTRLKNKIVRT